LPAATAAGWAPADFPKTWLPIKLTATVATTNKPVFKIALIFLSFGSFSLRLGETS
jgi:hypothetical protein